MVHLSVCVYPCLIYAANCLGDAPPGPDSPDHPLVEVPEALLPDDLGRAKQAEANEKKIHQGVEHQEAMMDHIAEELGSLGINSNLDAEKLPLLSWDNQDNIFYSESTLDDLEAPVIYLTPPVVLPDEQMEADKELENILVDTGLENKPKAVDPFRLTTLDEVNTAIKVCKGTIDNLRQKRKSLMKNIRDAAVQIATDHSKHATFKSLNQDLLEIEKKLDDELARLLQLEHVKKSLTKAHGAGHDVEDAEEDLEEREEELAHAVADEETEEDNEQEDSESSSHADEL
ncbi:phage infection protein, putative [Babesia ovis]|uniref:Phage infection protein, putative n=1 Tax=Babesia ovis TaxID=5869 RepID=A0A9W5TAM2_BABOV|nr:phage infection protein, putative [Babesia ovis]